MFSFFSEEESIRRMTPSPSPLNDVIDALEYSALSESQQRSFIKTFGRLENSKHHNTYLLLALAWSRLNATRILIELDKEKIALNLKDEYPSCFNTPLILAAKTGATEVVRQLINAGAEVDLQDYRGYTALHYACILRDDKMIQLLLKAGAAKHLFDAFGKLPEHYYLMNITANDLAYRYGLDPKDHLALSTQYDEDNNYFATEKKSLSALRWYIAHIIINKNWGKNTSVQGKKSSVNDFAAYYLKIREPVDNASVYKAMMEEFESKRPAVDMKLALRLAPSRAYLNPYQIERFDRFSVNPLFFVPQKAISTDKEGYVQVELQEIKSTGQKRVSW